jgi:isopentenyl diphosphate isomerase/L-lactate dehydrogenase-like FMN-dependent dehydrogenase
VRNLLSVFQRKIATAVALMGVTRVEQTTSESIER